MKQKTKKPATESETEINGSDVIQRCFEIAEQTQVQVSDLLSRDPKLAEIRRNVDFDLKRVKNILIYKGGAIDPTAPDISAPKRFSPIETINGKPIEKTISNPQHAESPARHQNPLTLGYDPTPDASKRAIYSQMINGRLASILMMRLRQGVEVILRQEKDNDHARSNYAFEIERIIQSYLQVAGYYAKKYSEDQINKLCAKYALQFRFLQEVSAWIEQGFTAEQIERKILR